jgi:hypothetical protein
MVEMIALGLVVGEIWPLAQELVRHALVRELLSLPMIRKEGRLEWHLEEGKYLS